MIVRATKGPEPPLEDPGPSLFTGLPTRGFPETEPPVSETSAIRWIKARGNLPHRSSIGIGS